MPLKPVTSRVSISNKPHGPSATASPTTSIFAADIFLVTGAVGCPGTLGIGVATQPVMCIHNTGGHPHSISQAKATPSTTHPPEGIVISCIWPLRTVWITR